jgi:chitinase
MDDPNVSTADPAEGRKSKSKPAAPVPGPPSAPSHAVEKRPTPAAIPFTIYRDPRSQAPWLYDGNTFWTFDDPTSIRFKVRFALKQQLGGVMAWELSEDTANATLLRAARSTIDQGSASGERAFRPPARSGLRPETH